VLTYDDISAAYKNRLAKQLCTHCLGVRLLFVTSQPFKIGCCFIFLKHPTWLTAIFPRGSKFDQVLDQFWVILLLLL